MLTFSVFICWFISTITVISTEHNAYDTYNADKCKRVRKSWNSLSDDEQQLYIDGLMELRKRGGGALDKDEFIAIGSVHQDDYGGIDHSASSYFFWHGYVLWEMESRIRNLGGKYACFAMPYWDFSEGNSPDDIFSDILGGYGDPDNHFNVNGYSWKYTTEEFWVPAHCDAEGDEFPICSLKRASRSVSAHDPKSIGAAIVNNPIFADFDRWYASSINLPHNLLTYDKYLYEPVVTSYDPIWYLFHSMVSYHQAIWTDCNDYDMIDQHDLDKYPEAYKPFCDDGVTECSGMRLDDRMYFGGSLQDKQWSFIRNNELTVRKAYYFPKWNIVYDLGDGHGFFTDSGLKDFCKGRLNPEWFMLADDDNSDKVLDRNSSYVGSNHLAIFNSLAITVGILVSIIFIAVYSCKSYKQKQEIKLINDESKVNLYGSV